jgi:hypothetical protein
LCERPEGKFPLLQLYDRSFLLSITLGERLKGGFMPYESIPQETLPLQSVPYAEGDRVRIKKGQYAGRTGTIERIGYSSGLLIDSVPLYFVRLDLLVYERDHIERVESGVGNG